MTAPRVAVLLAVLAPVALVPAARGADPGRTTPRTPSELTKQYPLGDAHLQRGGTPTSPQAGTARGGTPPATATGGGGSSGGSLPLLPFLLGAAALAAIGLGLITLRGRRPVLTARRPALAGPRPRPAAFAPVRPARRERGPRGVDRETPPGNGAGPVAAASEASERPAERVPVHPHSYAIANHKGGVGKTTVALVLGAALARRGRRVLIVDLDPQASATRVLGERDAHPTIADVLRDPGPGGLSDAVTATHWGVDLARSERALEAAGAAAPPDGVVLRRHLQAVGDYDVILIDCPPSLGALTLEAFAAVAHVVLVTEPSFLAVQAMQDVVQVQDEIKAGRNPELDLAGIIVNRVEASAEHRRGTAEIEEFYGQYVWQPQIPKRALLLDAMRRGVPPQDAPFHVRGEVVGLFDELAERIGPRR